MRINNFPSGKEIEYSCVVYEWATVSHREWMCSLVGCDGVNLKHDLNDQKCKLSLNEMLRGKVA